MPASRSRRRLTALLAALLAVSAGAVAQPTEAEGVERHVAPSLALDANRRQQAGTVRLERVARPRRQSEPGDRRRFFVRDLRGESAWIEMDFELLRAGDDVAFWVSESALAVFGRDRVAPVVDAIAERAATDLATVRDAFTDPPDLDGDGVLDALLFDVLDGYESSGAYVSGFFDPVDQLDAPTSNRADIVYLDLWPSVFRSGGDRPAEASATLAHEYQHLVHAAVERPWDVAHVFVNEGLSELAEILCGYPPRSAIAFARASPRTLISWDVEDPVSDYARASLWTHYLYERAGPEIARALSLSSLTGQAAVEHALAVVGAPSLETLFDDWGVTLLLDGEGPGVHRYQHPARSPLGLPLRQLASLPAVVPLPAPPWSHALVDGPRGGHLQVDDWTLAQGLVRAARGDVVVPVASEHSASPDDPYGSVRLLLTRDGRAGAAPWNAVITGAQTARDVDLAYDDGIPDPFYRQATHLLLAPGEAVATTFDVGDEARIREIGVQVLFESEIEGTGVGQLAARSVEVWLAPVENGRLGAPLAPPATVAKPLVIGDAGMFWVPMHATVQGTVALVVRSARPDNRVAVAMDTHPSAGRHALWSDGTSWHPLADRPVEGEARLGAHAPILRLRVVRRDARPSVTLARPTVTVTADSLTARFDGVTADDQSWAWSVTRTAPGRDGHLRAEAGGVVASFPLTDAGPLRPVVRLADPVTGEPRSGSYVLDVPPGPPLALGAPFPNPASGRAQVEVVLGERATVWLSLYDALGRRLWDADALDLPRGRARLPVSLDRLPAGLYLVRVRSEAAGGSAAASRSVTVVH